MILEAFNKRFYFTILQSPQWCSGSVSLCSHHSGVLVVVLVFACGVRGRILKP